jgi:NADH dehydrogenase/NADH:ubiquinone oxidoreductase subunit G
LSAVDWDTAFAKAAQILKGAKGKGVLLASAQASTEALFMTKKLLDGFDVTAGAFVRRSSEKEEPLSGFPNLALRPERSPNAAGAKALGFDEGLDKAGRAVSGAAVIVVLDSETGDFPLPSLGGGAKVIYLGTVLRDAARAADVVLPIANVTEEDGSFVNRDKRVQRYFQAKSAPGMARPAWWVAGELLSEMGKGDAPADAADAFARMASAVNDFGGLSYAGLGAQGVVLGAGRAMAGAAR